MSKHTMKMRTDMIGNRICAFAFLAASATLCALPPAVAAPTPYDGSWSMVLVTTSGHCGNIKIGMAVKGGQISATSGKFVMHRIALAGRIAGSGATKINGVAGPRKAYGIGKFNRARGVGDWNGTGPSGVCSGYWVANRA